MNERIVEFVGLPADERRVDRERGVLTGVKILGPQSKNGRVYPLPTLQQAVALYEGARVNVDHASGAGANGSSRDYEDRIGAIHNVACRPEGLYGDFHFNPKHRLVEQLLWDAEHSPANVGFSHNVLARTKRDGEQTTVEEILQVQSVDLVADPATTLGLFESTAATPESGDSLQTLREENRCLRAELAELRAAEQQASHRSEVDARIAAAELPAELVTEVFRQQCHEAADSERLERLLAARCQDARLLFGAGRPRSAEQVCETASGTFDAAAFAAAVR